MDSFFLYENVNQTVQSENYFRAGLYRCAHSFLHTVKNARLCMLNRASTFPILDKYKSSDVSKETVVRIFSRRRSRDAGTDIPYHKLKIN